MNCQTQVGGSCIVCDSANEDQKDCGFVKDSANPSVEICDPALGCFTEIYESEFKT